MPRIVVFSDVHGNLQALEAVHQDIKRRKPDHLLCLGDLVAFGPQPKETIAFLRDEMKPSLVLMGNTDHWLIDKVWQSEEKSKDMDPWLLESLAWTADRLGEDGLAYLGTLSAETRYSMGELNAFLCHASPGDDELGIVRGELARVADIVSRLDLRVLLCGHTHVPLRTRLGTTDVLNAGSVGLPFDGDFRPCYLSFFTGHGALQEITICRVSYSRSKTIDLLDESDMPGKTIVVHRLQTATASHPKVRD